jgi:haloalkane dehalogenase
MRAVGRVLTLKCAPERRRSGPTFLGEVMNYEEKFVQLNQHRIYAREYAGEEPTIILMHGFPDNVHLYDRLVPHLSPPGRIVAFDFLGWGASDKPVGYPYTATNQVLELAAVVKQLQLERVVLVAHDASGPPAIDWALAQAERVAGLVLLNTYYCEMPTLRAPEAIWLFSTPLVRSIARPVAQLFGAVIFHRMFLWQVGKFFRDAEVREEFLPLLYQQFDAIPSTRPAFFRLNEDLLPTIRARSKMIPTLREFKRPVRIIFGEADPYLNKGVAQSFHQLFPTSELCLLPGARHYVQMDEPDEVARLILSMPLASNE